LWAQVRSQCLSAKAVSKFCFTEIGSHHVFCSIIPEKTDTKKVRSKKFHNKDIPHVLLALVRLRQKDWKFKDSMGYIMRSCLKKRKEKK
jgi:hypothetical protein